MTITITLDDATRREILAQLEKAADVWAQEAEAAQFRSARRRAEQEATHARRMANIFLDDDDPLRDRRFNAPQWPMLADAQAAQRIADAAQGGGDACPTCGSGSPWRCGHTCGRCGDALDREGGCPSCADLPRDAGTEEPPLTIAERQAAIQRRRGDR